MTSQYTDQIKDQLGRPIANVAVYVYDQDDGDLSAIYSDGAGTSQPNPITADAYGNFSFYAADGYYDLAFYVGGKLVYREDGVRVGAPLAITAPAGSAVPTRALLAAVATPVSGQLAILTEAGREGEFVFSTSNLSAKVTADPAQAVYVAPSTDATGASGAWVRRYTPGVWQATWFGVVADGVTNDTVAIQRGWDYAAANGGGRIIYPAGVSIVSSALQDTGASNAQLVLPKVTTYDGVLAIELVGAGVPFSAEASGGTVWKSSLTGVGNVVGVKGAGSGVTFITLKMSGIAIRAPQNSGMTALDLSYVHYSDVNVRCDVPNLGDNSGLALTQPTDQHNCGIRTPINNISARCHLNKCVVFGYYFGVRLGELVSGEFIAAACNWAILTQTGSHPSLLGQVLVTNCPNGITANSALGGGALELNILLYDVEHDTTIASGGSGPSWVSPIGTDVDDPDNALHGFCNFHMHDTSLPFTVNGANNYKMRPARISYSSTTDYGPVASGFTSNTNMSCVDDLPTLFGGIPTRTYRHNLTGTSGTVGIMVFVNGGGTGTGGEYRVAQLTTSLDGSKDRGKYTVTVWRDGTAADALTIPSTAHIIPNVLPNAANDAAAAALTPPVPIGGLYRNGNAVQVRLT